MHHAHATMSPAQEYRHAESCFAIACGTQGAVTQGPLTQGNRLVNQKSFAARRKVQTAQTLALSLICSAGLFACAKEDPPAEAGVGASSASTDGMGTGTSSAAPMASPPATSTNGPATAVPPATTPAVQPTTPPAASPVNSPQSTPTSPTTPVPTASDTPSSTASDTASGGAGGDTDTPVEPGEGGEPNSPSAGGQGGDTAMGGNGGVASGDSDAGMMPGGFDPCPDAEPCAILPLGDSITEGIGSSNNSAYRGELFRMAIADGKDITYVGSRQAGPMDIDGTPFPRAHEGTSGITVSGLDDKLGGLVDQIGDAHIILVHLGTNDMYTQPGPAMAPQRLGVFLDNVMGYWPDALIVVAQITPYPSQDGDVQTYNAAIVPVVQERIDAGAHMMMVDQHTGFPDNELADVVHPNDDGYARMAGIWYEAIEPYLKP
jgi:lysophospholipase L1-like esterase